MRRRRPSLVHQVGASDCGAAALAMVLPALGVQVSPQEVREALDTGRDGASARDLRDAAREWGVGCRAFDVPALRSDPSSIATLPMPLIAHWEHDHFVVVEQIGRRDVRLLDPALGRRRVPVAEAAAGFTGVVLVFTAAAAAGRPARPRAGRGEGVLRSALWAYRRLLLVLAGISLALTGLAALVPAATAIVVDALARHAGPGAHWLLMAAGLAAATAALSWLRAVVTAALQVRLSRNLATRAVGRLLAAAYRYFERRSHGDVMNRLSAITAIRDLLAAAVVGAVLDTVMIVGYLVALFLLAPPVAVAALGLALVQLGAVAVLTTRALPLQREELHAQGQESAQLLEVVSGIAAIRSAAAEPAILARWRELSERAHRAAQRRAAVSGGAEAVGATVGVAGPLLLLLVAAGAGLAVGPAVGLAALAGSAVAAAGGLSASVLILAEAGPLIDRLADVMTAPPEQPDPRPPAPRLTGRVEIEEAGYRYDRRSPFALRRLTVTIAPGTKVAVVGTSGSGKSTLTKLLTGLHSPTEGRIRYDGHDLAGLDLRSVRQQLGVVLQEPVLGSGSIREVIAAGREVCDDAVHRAARLAEIHDEILAMPMGYHTRVGDGGVGLSGGQRQRVALARALLGSPTVLILDEATSALDGATEARIEANLSTLAMTRIVIAHRLSTVDDADNVVVLDRGIVVETGNPATLRTLNGPYAALARAQLQPA